MDAIELILPPHKKDLGGFSVCRLLPAATRQAVGPFLFLDHLGPATFPPGQGMDVRPHPHIGLATVTFLFEGIIRHRDSLGSVQDIRPGDVNWMTAGRGITHSERTPPEARAAGYRKHGIQTWVALPKNYERTEPAFHHHPAHTLPKKESTGVRVTVIAGSAFGLTSPVVTFSKTLYAAVELDAGAWIDLDDEHVERGVYVVEGDVAVDGRAVEVQHLAVLRAGATVRIEARASARLILLGGEPLDGRRHMFWNFVSSREDWMEEAKSAWQEERFEMVPGETERIPLPVSDR